MSRLLFSQVDQLLKNLPIPTTVIMPNKESLGAIPEHAKVALVAQNANALRNLASSQIGFLAIDYVEGNLDIKGSMRDLITTVIALQKLTGNGNPITVSKAPWLTHAYYYLKSITEHTKQRDAKQIKFHYDISDEFYALWLDPRRTYSCAYFQQKDFTLAQAQEAKLDHICRKLQLKSGERFLDIGAGWGSLLLWAVENYGVEGTGITLSQNQYNYMNQLIEEKGLQDRVRVLLCDYRELQEEPFDKVASVGMAEHVGKANMDTYFSALNSLLKPGGLFMHHSITAGGTRNHHVGQGMGVFIGKYIFPGGELLHVSEALRAMADAKLESLDIENLRPHYAKTLWAWSDALESRLDQARELTNEQIVRAYQLYLAGCAMSFEQGWVSIYQTLGAKPDHNINTGKDQTGLQGSQSSYPFNREYMYKH